MSKRRYVKRAVRPEPEEVSLTDFNRSLLHLIKTKPPKKDDTPPEELEKEK